jgi:hypothetical protein
VPLSHFQCGNIGPLGITGTPVIDERSQTLYVDAMVGGAAQPRHQIFALSLANGATLPGWPVEVGSALAAHDTPTFPGSSPSGTRRGRE